MQMTLLDKICGATALVMAIACYYFSQAEWPFSHAAILGWGSSFIVSLCFFLPEPEPESKPVQLHGFSYASFELQRRAARKLIYAARTDNNRVRVLYEDDDEEWEWEKTNIDNDGWLEEEYTPAVKPKPKMTLKKAKPKPKPRMWAKNPPSK